MSRAIKHPFAGRTTEDRDIGYDYRRKVGAHIRELRLRAGLTQLELGKVVGITNNAVSMIESGRNPLPPEHYRTFAEVLGENPKKFGLFLLEWTDPWLFGLIYGEQRIAGHNLDGIPTRIMNPDT